MSDMYLIKRTTLTNIANTIRENCTYNGDWTQADYITPEEMPSAIRSVRADGYSEGHRVGYDEGYDDGYEDGSRESIGALGVLCDWQLVSDSGSDNVLTVNNYHPSYYLHITITYSSGAGGRVLNWVISPNSSKSGFVGYTSGTHGDDTLSITNVRWKASAT